jgi:dTDP-glucose pyrophosphorylase
MKNNNWKNSLIKLDTTIEDALLAIDKGGFKMALVVDKNQYLLGTISDGDIRRALLKKKSLTDSISEIIVTTPQTALFNTPRSDLLSIMDKYRLSAIPLLENGKVIGLEQLHQVLEKKRYNNPVFLMAGGFGTRLKPLTDNCPKPLLKIGKKPILESVMMRFIDSGFHDFYISTHFMPELIREYFGNGDKWGVTINYIHESKPLGTGGALGLLPKDLPLLPIILMNGDILTKINLEKLLAFHDTANACATMCVREYSHQVPFGVVEGINNIVKDIVEKPTYQFRVNAGIYVLGREVIDSVNKNESIDMPTLLEKHMSKGVAMYTFHDYWLDIGRIDDYKKAQADVDRVDIGK